MRHGIGRLVVGGPKEDINTIIEGEFVKNNLHGFGRIIWPNGEF